MATLFTPFFQAIDGNGKPYPGALLNFYQTGTTTRLNTYTDSGLTTANANPVVADANGRFGAIYLGTTADYKVVLTTSAGVTIATLDPLFAAGTSGRTAVNDVAYNATISDRFIAFTALTVARNVNLPTAASFPAGTLLYIVDESGNASTTNTISLVPNGTDKIDGANATTVAISMPYGALAIEGDGSSKWTRLSKAYTRIKVTTFTTSGTWTVDTNCLFATLETLGGGGGGGGSPTAGANVFLGAGGGGAGSYSRKTVAKATAGTSQTVTIGAAGSAGPASNAGGNGGDTSVGTLCIGKGGSGGAAAVTGGAGGIAGTGDFTPTGATGGQGVNFGATGSSGSAIGGNGASSGYGGGGLGASTTTTANGGAATGFGSGGGGGASFNAGGTSTGGAGTAGLVVVTEYLSA